EIELVGRAGAGKLAQPPQRHLDVAGAELDRVVEVAELALVPDLHGAEMPALVLAHAHAFRIVAPGAVRRRSTRPDPLVAALMAPLLLGETLGQRLQKLVEAAHGFDLPLLLLGEVFFRELLEPFGRDLGGECLLHQLEAFEYLAEDAV